MKIDVTEKIKDYEGKLFGSVRIEVSEELIKLVGEQKAVADVVKMLEPFKAEGRSVRDILYESLNGTYVDADGKQERLTADDKAKLHQISKKLFDTNDPDFTLKEAALIVERVDKVQLSPLICGRIHEIFEPQSKAAE